MIHVCLRGPGPDQRYQLDTPDVSMVGPWLKSIFDELKLPPYRGMPLSWTIEIQ